MSGGGPPDGATVALRMEPPTSGHGGGGGLDRTLYADPPPSLLGFGPEVPDHGH